jgi:protein TonB
VPEYTGAVFQPGKNGIEYPHCISCPAADYTDEARNAKFQGVVDLDAVVTPEGKVANIRVVRGPGMGLEERAIEAVSQWRFNPAVDAIGKPVAVRVPIEVIFKLY